MRIVTLLLFFHISLNMTHASVWDTQNYWSDQWEEAFQDWVESEKLHPQIFKTDLYQGIKVDCADAAYAFRIIFSMRNALPFKMANPFSGRDGKLPFLTNEVADYDHIELKKPEDGLSEVERREQMYAPRVIQFINDIGRYAWTEGLAARDTYPLSLDSLNSGSLFLYKIKSNGNFIRHAYVIKDISETGDFDLIYSTQKAKRENRDLYYKKNKPLSHAPILYQWGFRYFKQPEHYEGVIEQASLKQFEIAKELGEKGFFSHVKKLYSTRIEGPQERLEKAFKNLCEKSQSRIEVVQSAIDYLKRTNNACMSDYSIYNTYSTPSFDSEVRGLADSLKSEISGLLTSGEDSQVENELWQDAQNIFNQNLSDQEKQLLIERCPINITSEETLDLNHFILKLYAEKVSNHPNDNLSRRWGIENGKATVCKKLQ